MFIKNYRYLTAIENMIIPVTAIGSVTGGIYMGCTADQRNNKYFGGYQHKNDYLHTLGVVTMGGVFGGAAGAVVTVIYPVILGAAVIAAPIHLYKSRSNLK